MINHCTVNVTVLPGAEILQTPDQFRSDFLKMISELSSEEEVDFIGVELLSNEQIFDQFKKMVTANVEKDIIGEFIINEICKAMAEKKPVVISVTQPETTTKETTMNTADQAETKTTPVESIEKVSAEPMEPVVEKINLQSEPFFGPVLKTCGIAVLGAAFGAGGLWIWNRFAK